MAMENEFRLQLFLGDKTSQILGCGMKLKIFDQLDAESAKTSDSISKILNLPFRGIDRVLLYSTEFGITKVKDEGFVRGELWEEIMKLRKIAENFCGEWYNILMDIEVFLKKGSSHDKSFDDYFRSNTKLFIPNMDNKEVLTQQRISFIMMYQLLNYLGSKYDLFAKIVSKPSNVEEIRSILTDEVHPDLVPIIIEYFVNYGWIVKKEDEKYTIEKGKEMIPYCFSGDPAYLRIVYSKFWRHLEHSLRTGLSATEKEFGKPYFEYMESNTVLRNIYHNSIKKAGKMLPNLAFVNENIPEFGLEEVTTLCDVGGSTGTCSIPLFTVSKKKESLKIKVLDLQKVVKEQVVEEELKGKLEFIGGSFFEAETIPKEQEMYVLRAILHDWPREEQMKILKNVASVMKEGSRVLIISSVFERMFTGAAAELHTLTCYGRAYIPTIDQFRKMCQENGLKEEKIQMLPKLRGSKFAMCCLMFKK